MRVYWLVLGICCGLAGNVALASDDFELPPINYSQSKPQNRVSRLMEDVEQGKQSLQYDDKFGYLKPLLDALEVPVSSQMLVYSKTSLQRQRIAPRTPRARAFVPAKWFAAGEVFPILIAGARRPANETT